MSIKPRFAKMIFDGTKSIELRRVCPKVEKGDLVMVYVSGPRMALLGSFEVGGIVMAPPADLARDHLKASGLTREELLNYFSDKVEGYGILIRKVWQLPQAKELKCLRKIQTGFHPPQSYRYLGGSELMKLLR